ncbi:MAG TPA: helix-turn-helix transcriptional regulator [Marmoricola sp.]
MPSMPGTALGEFIREQRQLARLSLREMARLTSISNAYLSQVERGLHAPSVRVLHAVSDALGIPLEDLIVRTSPSRADAPATGTDAGPSEVERAIRQERRLTTAQKEALISVLQGFLEQSYETDHPA